MPAKPSKAAPDAEQELATLYPSPIEITVGGETIKVEPLGIRKLGAVSRPLRRIAESMPAGDIGMSEIVVIFTDHTEDMIEAIVAATGKPEAWVAALMFPDFVKIGMAVFKVNADFFARQLPGLASEVKAIVEGLGAGLTSSTTSNGAATPTRTN